MSETNTLALIPITDIQKMAQYAASSKLFGVKTEAEAAALMLVAQAEGMHPMTAVQEFHIIQGRPARKAEAMLARFQRAGGMVKWNEYNDRRVAGVFSHPQGGSVEIVWTMERAKAIGLANKDNWKNYPAPMMRSRCISEGVRTVYPGATGGMYTPEELEELPPPKDMGAVEVVQSKPAELPPYPPEKFVTNLPIWLDKIASGIKTGEQIITMVSSKYTMSEEQLRQIAAKPHVVAKPMPAPDAEGLGDYGKEEA